MDIFNIEKLDLSKPVVLTGRNEHIEKMLIAGEFNWF